MRPPQQHVICLQDHIAVCEENGEDLGAAITLAETETPPQSHWHRSHLLELYRSRLAFQTEAETCRLAISYIRWIPIEYWAKSSPIVFQMIIASHLTRHHCYSAVYQLCGVM